MTDSLKSAIGKTIAALFFTAFAALLIGLAIHNLHANRNLLRNGETARGKLVGYIPTTSPPNQTTRPSASFYPRFQFTTPDGQTHDGQGEMSLPRQNLNVGDPLTVLYDRGDPDHRSSLSTKAELWGVPIGMLGGGLVAFFFTVWLVGSAIFGESARLDRVMMSYVALVTFFLGVCATTATILELRTLAHLFNAGAGAIGKVVEVERRYDSRSLTSRESIPSYYYTHVEFIDVSGAKHHATGLVGHDQPSDQVGQSIAVLYDPEDATVFRLHNFAELYLRPLAFSAGALVLLGMSGACLRRGRCT